MLESTVKDFEQLAKSYPDVPEYRQRLSVVRSHLAQVLQKLGEPEAAAEAFLAASKTLESLCRNDPKNPACYDDLAFVYAKSGGLLQETGKLADAEKTLRKARQTWKDLVDQYHLPEHAYNLAWFLADCPMMQLRDPAAAIEMAKQASDRAPANPDYWRALGAAYFRAEQWQNGLLAIEEAIRRRSQPNARDWFVKAMLQQRAGQTAEAGKSYQTAKKAMHANETGNLEVRRLQKEAAELLKLAD
jgi:tetratricopeptide (TPR) repeat protein